MFMEQIQAEDEADSNCNSISSRVVAELDAKERVDEVSEKDVTSFNQTTWCVQELMIHDDELKAVDPLTAAYDDTKRANQEEAT